MQLITKIVVLLVIIKLAKSAPDPCALETEESACDQTEYEAYKECVHSESIKKVRRKRQAPCPTQTNLDALLSIKENCQRANFDCRIKCEDDESCQNQCPVCPINVDELIASSNASSGETHHTIIVESDQNVEKFHTINAAGNITTIIRLTNVINPNSSVSDPPAVENEDGDSYNETGGEFGLGFNAHGPCCHVVHPSTCTSTSNGRRCHHRREKVCGKICTAKVVHVRARKRCNGNGCHEKISYVPQPKPPKCVHTRKWPYVACGQSYSSSCDGCYDHYDEDGDNEANAKENANNDCDGCYDDGFDYGPLYRHGPVYRPYFYHVPPCFIFGTCIPYPADGYGYFGYHSGGSYDHHKRHQHDEHHGREEEEVVDFEDTEDADGDVVKTTIPANKTEDTADDWAVELHKCKVVSDDETIEIRNCTSEDIEENPYARAPPEVDFDEDYDGIGEGVRIERQVHHQHHQFHHLQVVYVPVFEHFNYNDAASDEYDFVEEPNRPQQHRRVRQSKPSSNKRQHRKTSFVYDDENDDPIE